MSDNEPATTAPICHSSVLVTDKGDTHLCWWREPPLRAAGAISAAADGADDQPVQAVRDLGVEGLGLPRVDEVGVTCEQAA